MPIEVREIRAFEGPNLYYPQTSVKLTVWADHDISRQISDTLKTWAQVIGLVIGYLRQQSEPSDGGVLITTTWTTPLPTIGAMVAQQVVADLDAAERHDEEYDHDQAMFDIIAERKRQEPSMALLQVYAEAHAREVSIMRRSDGHLVIGSGARSWSFDPAVVSLGIDVDIPWDQIGTVPIVAVTGPDAAEVTRSIATLVEGQGLRVGRAASDGMVIDGIQISSDDSANFDGTRRVLIDPRVDIAIVEVSAASILERGIGFDQCHVGVVTGITRNTTHAQVSEQDWVAAHGIVVLSTRQNGTVVLNANVPAVLGLREWASGRLMLYSESSSAAESHLDHDGDLVYRDGSTIHLLINGQQEELRLDKGESQTAYVLPALAVAHVLGINTARHI